VGRRARYQVRGNNAPGGRFTTNSNSRRVRLKRFINRQRVSFELSFTTTHACRVIESHRTGDKRIRHRTPVADNHANVRDGRLGRTIERSRAKRRFERRCATRVQRDCRLSERHTLLIQRTHHWRLLSTHAQHTAKQTQTGSNYSYHLVSFLFLWCFLWLTLGS